MRIILCCLESFLLLFLQLLLPGSTKSENISAGSYIPYHVDLPGGPFCILDTVPVADTFDFYVSNQGSEANNGTSPSTPKSSVDNITNLINNYAQLNNQASIGLEAGSNFREQFNISRNNIKLSSFGVAAGKKPAQITGMDVVSDWSATQGRNNVFEYTVNHSIDLGSPNYHYVFVAEIDTVLEKLFPLSAVRYLSLVSNTAQCEASPGSFFIAPLRQNPVTLYIHPTQGIPGKNRFRYEVVKRPYAINSFYLNNCSFENLLLQSSGNGYGMLGAGDNTSVKSLTFQGGGTHHAVIKSGSVDKSLFLPGPKGIADEIALVFYKPDGTGSNRVSNSVFLDIKNPVFSHTNGTSSYRRLTVDSVYAFADTLYSNTVLSADNTDTVSISNSYSYGYKNFWVGLSPSVTIRNSVINGVSEPAIYLGSLGEIACNAVVSNTLIKTNGNDANQGPPQFQPTMGFRFAQASTSLKVSNIIFHGKSTWHTLYTTATVFANTVNNKLEAVRNIYICDVNPENYLHVVTAGNAAGKGTASNLVSDYNVYVLLRGALHWLAYPNSPGGDGNIFSLKEWQAFTGQDQHSILLDLRNNPAGLKAIFTDPETGNWSLAQTPQADSVRNLQAGMLTPPLFYPLRPVYEDALDHTLPGGLSYFTGSRDSTRQVKMEWKTITEPNLAYFGVESGTDKSNFTRIADVKTLGRYKDNLYTSVDPNTSLSRVYYRLRLVNTDSSFTFSSTIAVDPLKKDSIINGIGGVPVGIVIYPNPVQERLTVEHPARTQAEISVYDFTGRLLSTLQVQQNAAVTTIPVVNLPAGKYVIKWRSGPEKKALSFIKSR